MVVYALNTGKQGLTPSRIQEIQSNLPKEYQDIPIIEIRPGATPVRTPDIPVGISMGIGDSTVSSPSEGGQLEEGTPDGPPSDGLPDIGLPDEGIPDFLP